MSKINKKNTDFEIVEQDIDSQKINNIYNS